MAVAFPFSAIVGQDEMKLAILAAAVDPRIGGVLVFGWWQLRSVERDQEQATREREARKTTQGDGDAP